jgi:hypothetical protein
VYLDGHSLGTFHPTPRPKRLERSWDLAMLRGQPSGGNCVAFQLPKVRMVRVPRAASIGQQGNLAKSGVTASRARAR